MRRERGVLSAVYLVSILTVVVAVAVPASAAVVQLTSDPTYSSERAAISADGSSVAFDSEADLAGGNADHSYEIFVINADGTGLRQLTASSTASFTSCRASVSGDGSKVAFQSDQDLTGGNADNSMEVFIVNADGTGLLQLTSSSGWRSNCEAVLSADGSKVVFSSSNDLTGGNADNSTEIFVVNSDGTGLTQVTSSVFGTDFCCMPDISADGSKVVFQSDGVLIGSANLDKSMEVFAANSDGTGLVQLTDQLSTSYACCTAKISGDGSKVTFASDADLTGANGDHTEEIFVVNTDGTGLAQLSSDSVVTNESDDPCINADGSVVVFESSADLTGGNPDYSDEIMVVNSDGTGLLQLTSASLAAVDSQNPCISADGSKVAFDSEADLTGGNADANEEVFLALLGGQATDRTPWVAVEYTPPVTPTSLPEANAYSSATYSDVDPDHQFWGTIEELSVTVTPATFAVVGGYPDGSYRPTWTVNRAQMAVFVARAAGLLGGAPETPTFPDVPESYWSYLEIERCVDAGVVAGFPDGLYRPTEDVTRGQMAVFIQRAANLPTAAYTAEFLDVDDTHWAAEYIQACVDADIVAGYPDGFYRPERIVNRGEMSVFVWRGLVCHTGGNVLLGWPAVSDEAWLDPGDGNAQLFLPTAVTATGARIVDSEGEYLPLGADAVLVLVLDGALVGDGTIEFTLVHEDDNGTPDDEEDDFTVTDDTETLTVNAATVKAAVNSAGGSPYLVAAYHLPSTLVSADYGLVLGLPDSTDIWIVFRIP